MDKLRTRVIWRDGLSMIVILGTLSAFALPGFANVERASRQAALDDLSLAIGHTAALVHALWVATGSTGDSVKVEGKTVTVNASGYPADETAMHGALLTDPLGHGYVLTSAGFAPTAVADAEACSVHYDASVSPPLIYSPRALDCE